MEPRYTWDPENARANRVKHGVSFEVAVQVFADPNHITSDNYLMNGEQRLQVIGMTRGLMLLLVVFIDCNQAGADIIRVISARKANAYEQSAYEDQFR